MMHMPLRRPGHGGYQQRAASGDQETQRLPTDPAGSPGPGAHWIMAQVVGFADLVEAGSMTAVRSAGKARVEGKEYVMQDGDVVEFRFNV